MNEIMKAVTVALAALALNWAAFPANATGVGTEIPVFSLKDSAGNPRSFDETVRRLYANSDRKGDELMKTAMTGLTQAQLEAQKAAVIAEISAAPFFVKSIIRSSLKDRSYLTWLDVTGSTKSFLPYRPSQVTVIEVEARRIKAIRFVDNADALRREIVPPATPAK